MFDAIIPWFEVTSLARRILVAVACCGLIGISADCFAAKPSPERSDVVFENDVRPILKAFCFHCHGELKELGGGLDVRLVRLLSKGGESGSAIRAGNHADSLLFQRIAKKEMPPGEKKLSDADIAKIARWIDLGAKTQKPEPETISDITDDDRAFWSFQPIRRITVPMDGDMATVRSPIDAFLLAELKKHELSFSPEASPATLIRRLYFDLIGLPPKPEEVDAFVKESSGDNERADQAYIALVDRLLASPHYGERWGRHWLDVAGYADSDGYTPLDPARELIYKYRDYVIRSFNDDKPWDEFIIEQLAGDELVGAPVKTPTGPEMEKLIATGYLRLAPDGTSDTSVDQPVARNDVIAETIKIVSTSLLGLTVGCAQCHNHRYDPISQKDYYAFRALFEPAYDWKVWRPTKARLVSTLSAEERKKKTAHEAQITKISGARSTAYKKMADEVFEQEIAKVPEEFHATIRKGRELQPQRRTMEQADLFKKYAALTVTPESVRAAMPERYEAFVKEFDEPLEKLRAVKQPTEDFVHVLTEVPGKVSPTHFFFRGDHNNPREEVKPGELSVLADASDPPIPDDDPSLPTTGRRLAYAKRLTSGKHPLLARVLVNRFWLHHFGRGLVASPGDFGFLGQRPSHPELLDWLASDFMDGGWRLKRFHKMLLVPSAYRQSSTRSDKLDSIDPENRLLGRMSVRRIDAESLRDSILAVAGNLNDKMFGKPIPVTPNESGQVVLGVDTRDGAGRFQKPIASLGHAAHRRSLYVQARRTLPLGIMETFDAPAMNPNCECRASSTVTPQMLLLMNNDFVIEQSTDFAKRLQSLASDDPATQLSLGWQIAFGTPPTADQLQEAAKFLEETVAVFRSASTQEKNPPSPELRALALYCQSLLSANRFLYVD